MRARGETLTNTNPETYLAPASRVSPRRFGVRLRTASVKDMDARMPPLKRAFMRRRHIRLGLKLALL
jgi:hypothetical protein